MSLKFRPLGEEGVVGDLAKWPEGGVIRQGIITDVIRGDCYVGMFIDANLLPEIDAAINADIMLKFGGSEPAGTQFSLNKAEISYEPRYASIIEKLAANKRYQFLVLGKTQNGDCPVAYTLGGVSMVPGDSVLTLASSTPGLQFIPAMEAVKRKRQSKGKEEEEEEKEKTAARKKKTKKSKIKDLADVTMENIPIEILGLLRDRAHAILKFTVTNFAVGIFGALGDNLNRSIAFKCQYTGEGDNCDINPAAFWRNDDWARYLNNIPSLDAALAEARQVWADMESGTEQASLLFEQIFKINEIEEQILKKGFKVVNPFKQWEQATISLMLIDHINLEAPENIGEDESYDEWVKRMVTFYTKVVEKYRRALKALQQIYDSKKVDPKITEQQLELLNKRPGAYDIFLRTYPVSRDGIEKVQAFMSQIPIIMRHYYSIVYGGNPPDIEEQSRLLSLEMFENWLRKRLIVYKNAVSFAKGLKTKGRDRRDFRSAYRVYRKRKLRFERAYELVNMYVVKRSQGRSLTFFDDFTESDVDIAADPKYQWARQQYPLEQFLLEIRGREQSVMQDLGFGDQDIAYHVRLGQKIQERFNNTFNEKDFQAVMVAVAQSDKKETKWDGTLEMGEKPPIDGEGGEFARDEEYVEEEEEVERSAEEEEEEAEDVVDPFGYILEGEDEDAQGEMDSDELEKLRESEASILKRKKAMAEFLKQQEETRRKQKEADDALYAKFEADIEKITDGNVRRAKQADLAYMRSLEELQDVERSELMLVEEQALQTPSRTERKRLDTEAFARKGLITKRQKILRTLQEALQEYLALSQKEQQKRDALEAKSFDAMARKAQKAAKQKQQQFDRLKARIEKIENAEQRAQELQHLQELIELQQIQDREQEALLNEREKLYYPDQGYIDYSALQQQVADREERMDNREYIIETEKARLGTRKKQITPRTPEQELSFAAARNLGLESNINCAVCAIEHKIPILSCSECQDTHFCGQMCGELHMLSHEPIEGFIGNAKRAATKKGRAKMLAELEEYKDEGNKLDEKAKKKVKSILNTAKTARKAFKLVPGKKGKLARQELDEIISLANDLK